HGVERVHRRHVEAGSVPVAIASAQWQKLVVSPGVLLVPVPGMKKLRADLLSSGGGGGGVIDLERGAGRLSLRDAQGLSQKDSKNSSRTPPQPPHAELLKERRLRCS